MSLARAGVGLVVLVLAPVAVASASAPRSSVEFRFADPAITESSGLVARDGLFVTVNDSGDVGRVFTVDPADGRTVGVTTWTADGADPVDVEAVAPVLGAGSGSGSGEVWVADIGDNSAVRDAVTVVRVPVGRGDRAVAPTPYRLRYPGGSQDAETLLVDADGRLLVVTKGLLGGEFMIAPRRLDPDGPNRLRPVGDALGFATDGAFFPDGRHLVVRGYVSAAVYTYPGLREIGRFDLPEQPQGEGIAVDADGAVFVSSEGAHTRVLRVRLPAAVAAAVAPVQPSPPSASPSSGPRDPEQVVPGGDQPAAPSDGPLWPWAVGGFVGLGALVLLVRALRPRR